VGRRALFSGATKALGAALLAPLAMPLGGCFSAAGEHDLQTFFVLRKSPGGRFAGWTRIDTNQEPSADQQVIIKRVALFAPQGLTDLTFIQAMVGQSTPASGQATPLVRAPSAFPKNDSIGLMEVVYKDDIQRFVSGTTIQIDWSGQYDPALTFPSQNFYTINAQVTVEVI
jgi:hypothetical protein